ncbi:hypothetical protein KS4_28470 [Poriferisphaera corsica]|uniref:DUF2752 domain-containing protein n=1 Tax=Poriferisphaera corsica TaxID=2528020 RepID=A0A517YX31_9BACT|nr:DUF2752 domain-containing protein [Poriferisphaera corsica]QDU34772.1 hypothetical protein KS4_28470 [Poriferisphaera corsica]
MLEPSEEQFEGEQARLGGAEIPEAVSACDDHRRVHPGSLNGLPRDEAGRREVARRNRVMGGVFLGVVLFPLLLAWLVLSPENGLQQTMNIPPCGFKLSTGLPCLTCGMTTSFTHAVRGDLWIAFLIQPFGMMLSVVCAGLSWVFGWAVVSGMSLDSVGRFLWRPRVVVPVVVLLVLSWLYNVVATMSGFHT